MTRTGRAQWIAVSCVIMIACGACGRQPRPVAVQKGASPRYPGIGRTYPTIGRDIPVSRRVPTVEKALARVRKRPQDANGYFSLGLAHFRDLRYPDAISALNEGLRLEPKRWRGYEYLGYSLMGCGRLAEAAEAFGRIPPLTSNVHVQSFAYLESANCYWDLRQYTEAEAAYRRSLQLNPAQGFADLSLGALEAQRGQWIRAEQHFLRASTSPSEPKLRASGYAGLGYVYEKRGDRRAALAAYKKAMALDPGNENAQGGMKRIGPE